MRGHLITTSAWADRADQAIGWRVGSHDHVQERGLAATRPTNQTNDLAACDLQGDSGEHLGATESLADPTAFQTDLA